MERLAVFSLAERFGLIGLAERLLGVARLLSFGQMGLVAQGSAATGGDVILLEPAVSTAEFVVASVKDLVFAQFTGKRSVKERNLGRRLESYLVKALVVVTDNPRLAANQCMFETLSQGFIESQQVVIGKTLAVRRVGYDDGAFLYRLKVLDVTLLKQDGVKQTCGLGVALCGQYGFGILVVTLDAELERTLGRVIIVNLLKEVAVKILPFLKSET